MNKVKKWLVFFQHLNNEIDTHDLPTIYHRVNHMFTKPVEDKGMTYLK